MESVIRKRIAKIRDEIRQAAEISGRPPSGIRLMAVTKNVDDMQILEAIDAGVDIIGENYVQEARRKIAEMGRLCEFHMIGRLQTNKAKYAVSLFDMIQSVDRMELAQELDKRSLLAGRVTKILIEVNIGAEASKSGIPPGDALSLVRRIASLEGLSVCGLMTMPPWYDEPEHSRPYFVALRELRNGIAAEKIDRVAMDELSMGTSGDYRAAAEEGATIVRIGRAIFGERLPK